MDVMAKAPKTLSAKIGHLCKYSSPAEVARNVGISRQALMNYIEGESAPGAGALFGIARHFNVPLDYLLDDTYPIEPPETGSAALATTDQLMQEVRRRYTSEAEQVRALLDDAEKIDWDYIRRELSGMTEEPHYFPEDYPDLVAALNVIRSLWLVSDRALRRFDISDLIGAPRSGRSGREPDPTSLHRADLMERYHRLFDGLASDDAARVKVHSFMVENAYFAAEPESLIEVARQALNAYERTGGRYVSSE
jgi:transcriptional regulator with XRE-family HTH domain